MLKKITLLVFIPIVSILTLNANELSKVTITFKSASLAFNDHVGSDWSYGAWVNEEEINQNEEKILDVKKLKTIKLRVRVVEDEKNPDVGVAQKTIRVSDLVNNQPIEIVLKAVVTEDRGRYSGNQAQWEFTFLIAKN